MEVSPSVRPSVGPAICPECFMPARPSEGVLCLGFWQLPCAGITLWINSIASWCLAIKPAVSLLGLAGPNGSKSVESRLGMTRQSAASASPCCRPHRSESGPAPQIKGHRPMTTSTVPRGHVTWRYAMHSCSDNKGLELPSGLIEYTYFQIERFLPVVHQSAVGALGSTC